MWLDVGDVHPHQLQTVHGTLERERDRGGGGGVEREGDRERDRERVQQMDLLLSVLIDTNGFSILPCNEFSIKPVNTHYDTPPPRAPLHTPTTPHLQLLLWRNPIPQTTPAEPIMDSPFHRLWLVFLWHLVNISALFHSSLLSPLCCIDLFAPPHFSPLCAVGDNLL